MSGIVGANGTVTGVAPGVTFGAYRVFGCAGSTESDIMIAAMERALADGMDVLNMSIGDAFNSWPGTPTAQASTNLVNQGIVVVASIGNSGASGVYSAGAPGVGEKVIGTASYDNTFSNLSEATVTPAGLSIGHTSATGAPPAPLSGSLPLAKANALGALPTGPLPTGAGDPLPADGCVGAPPGTFTGKMVIIRRGTCGFYQKARLAQLGGASAVALYNNCLPNCGRVSPTVAVVAGIADGNPVTIPVVAISDTEGIAIHNAIVSGAQTWTWTSGTISLPNATGGTISSFSSFGLAADLTVKPDIGAPGGLIRSTYPVELGSYGNNSGTSMASPHVAGAVALLLEAHPNTNVNDVRDILQNSADPKIRFGQTYLDNVHRQGAGMLDIDDAILATTLLKPGKLSLGEGNGGTRTITLSNSSGSPVTYDLSHEPAAGTTNTFPAVAYSTDYASASFPASVAVPAGGSTSVQVTITPNAAMPNKGVYGGYITFTPQGGGQVYRVPYAGFKGDYQSIQVLAPTANGFPWLARLTACNPPGILRGSECFGGGSYSQPPAADPYTFKPGLNETPMFLVHFDHQARSMKIEIYRPGPNRDVFMGVGLSQEFMARNSTATSFFPFAWDGSLKRGGPPVALADGTYYAKIIVQKALGTAQETETWTSPNFVVDRF